MTNRGNVAILIIILILGGVVFYFWSDPFRAKVDQKITQATSWTPENIQRDPIGYLTWAQAECNVLSQKLEAREIAIKAKENECNRMLLEKEADIKALTELLDEAKLLYKTATAENNFPANLRNIQMDEKQLKTKIVEAYQRVEQAKGIVPVLKNTISSLQQKLSEIRNRKTETDALYRKIGSDIELAKVKKETSGIGELSTEFTSLLDTTNVVISPDAIPSVEDMAKMSSKDSIDIEFEKIMAQ